MNSFLLDEIASFKERSKLSQTIPIAIDVEGKVLITVGDITPYKEMFEADSQDTDSTI